MIKKIVFKNLLRNGVSFTAFGSVRFYDKDGEIIPSGNVISQSDTFNETENMTITSLSAYGGSASYQAINVIDTNKERTSGYYYWLTSSGDVQNLTITFKNDIKEMSKMDFVCKQGGDRGTGDFNIDVFDESDTLIQTYPITASTTVNEIQTLLTPELMPNIKFLIKDKTDNLFSIKNEESGDGEDVTFSLMVHTLQSGTIYRGSPEYLSNNNTTYPNVFVVSGTTTNVGFVSIDLGLGNEKAISKLLLKNMQPQSIWNTMYVKEFKLQANNTSGENSADWVDIYVGQTINSDFGAIDTFEFEASQTKYRYWRIFVINNWGYGGYISIAEWELIGQPTLTNIGQVNLENQILTEQLFIEQGFNDITLLNMATFNQTNIMNNEGILGNGNVFSVDIDIDMIKDVNIT